MVKYKPLRPRDVLRDYLSGTNMKKNLRQLRRMAKRLDADIRLLETRIDCAGMVNHVHAGVPFSLEKKRTAKNVAAYSVRMVPVYLNNTERWAELVREDPRSWVVHAYDRKGIRVWRSVFASRHRTKKLALEVACEHIALNKKPSS